MKITPTAVLKTLFYLPPKHLVMMGDAGVVQLRLEIKPSYIRLTPVGTYTSIKNWQTGVS